MGQHSIMIFLFSLSPVWLFPQSATLFLGGNICPDSNWSLVFNEDFNVDSLDGSKWITYFPYGPNGDDQCEFCRTHGDEGQIYTDSNFTISNGTLKLIARRQNATWFSASRDFTSCMIHTKNEFRFMYGRFEIRCKIPRGKGLYSAFWAFGGNGEGAATEIDMFEISGRNPNHHHLALWKYQETELTHGHSYAYDDVDLSLDFHTYNADWDPFSITFSVDGNEKYKISRFYTLSGTKVTWCCVVPGVYNVLPEYPNGANNTLNLIVNLSIETNEDAPDATTVFPSQLDIDYIRVYQRDLPSSRDFDCEVLLYPNPNFGILKIRKKKMNSIKIENMLGEIMLSKLVYSDETEVDVSSLVAGIYFVEAQTSEGTFANKFIKE